MVEGEYIIKLDRGYTTCAKESELSKMKIIDDALTRGMQFPVPKKPTKIQKEKYDIGEEVIVHDDSKLPYALFIPMYDTIKTDMKKTLKTGKGIIKAIPLTERFNSYLIKFEDNEVEIIDHSFIWSEL